MLVRISASPSGPLSVIGNLPDANLAILEGYNGIGKTLAVRILQLCTGTMPYALGSPAWESLREGLNEIEVEITELEGADRVVWVADSAEWEAGDGPVPRTDWFKSITIDGQSASLDDVRRLITVIRLAGDEDLTDTFAFQAETHAATVQRWTAKHADPEHGPLKQLEDLAGIADDLLSSFEIAEFVQLKFEADQAKQDLVSKRTAADQLQARRRQINEAVELRRRVSDMRTKAPEVQREIDEVDGLISEQQSKLEVAQEEVTHLAAQAGRTEPLERELGNAERTLQRNIKKLDAAWRRAAAKAAELDINADAEAASKLVEELTLREKQLVLQHQEQHKPPVMIELLGSLTNELLEAESRGLGDQVAVDDADSGMQLSVSKTRAGMVTRQSYLEQQLPPARAVEISQELNSLSDRRSQVEYLLTTLDEIKRFEYHVSRNEERVSKALQEGAGGEASEALKSAANRRFECDQALRELAVRRAGLAQRLGASTSNTSEQALMEQLNSVLESVDILEERLESERIEIEKQFVRTEAELAVADSMERDIQQRLAHTKASIHNTVELLESDERLSWVREALNRQYGTPSGDIEHQHQDLVRAQNLVHEVLERLGNHRNQLSAVERALQGTARLLRGQTVDAFEYVEQVKAWLASSFSKWFNDPRVRNELLKNADEEADVTVDLGTRRVAWSENENRRSRPLEAFSSGEQAFAYTRARLAVLADADVTVKNRLIVLDEFGAFISHHLLQGMLDYLKEWTSDRQSDRVLLILPLSRDYSQMAQNSIGARATRFAALARHVDDHGYATRTIVR